MKLSRFLKTLRAAASPREIKKYIRVHSCAFVVLILLCQPLAAKAQALAFQLPCEIQTADEMSLPDLVWSQGSTPLIEAVPMQNGLRQKADTATTVRMLMGPSATSQYFVAATNSPTTNNATSYPIQWPTLGTNTAGQAWWYTVYFERSGLRYWTGSGRLYITATTSTADGLHWQEITTGGARDYAITTPDGRRWQMAAIYLAPGIISHTWAPFTGPAAKPFTITLPDGRTFEMAGVLINGTPTHTWKETTP